MAGDHAFTRRRCLGARLCAHRGSGVFIVDEEREGDADDADNDGGEEGVVIGEQLRVIDRGLRGLAAADGVRMTADALGQHRREDGNAE